MGSEMCIRDRVYSNQAILQWVIGVKSRCGVLMGLFWALGSRFLGFAAFKQALRALLAILQGLDDVNLGRYFSVRPQQFAYDQLVGWGADTNHWLGFTAFRLFCSRLLGLRADAAS